MGVNTCTAPRQFPLPSGLSIGPKTSLDLHGFCRAPTIKGSARRQFQPHSLLASKLCVFVCVHVRLRECACARGYLCVYACGCLITKVDQSSSYPPPGAVGPIVSWPPPLYQVLASKEIALPLVNAKFGLHLHSALLLANSTNWPYETFAHPSLVLTELAAV